MENKGLIGLEIVGVAELNEGVNLEQLSDDHISVFEKIVVYGNNGRVAFILDPMEFRFTLKEKND